MIDEIIKLSENFNSVVITSKNIDSVIINGHLVTIKENMYVLRYKIYIHYTTCAEQVLRMVSNEMSINENHISVDNQVKVKCTCRCHIDNHVIHFAACCRDGFNYF